MRKGVGFVLAAVGAFLFVLGLLGQFWAPDHVMKTPIDVNSTTRLEGQAELADGTGGTSQFPVRATSITHADSEKSDGEVVAFDTSSCLFKNERAFSGDCPSINSGDVLSASTDAFATDRTSAEAVNEQKYLPAGSEQHAGLINKWPFEPAKKTYQYWDGTAGKAVDATYDGTQTIDGVKTYAYHVVVPDVAAEISNGVQGTYSYDGKVWVDKVTGAIIDQKFKQTRLDTAGDPFLLLDLGYTSEQVKKNADDAKSNATSLALVQKWIPLAGWVVGLPLLVIGIVVLLLAFRGAGAHRQA